MLARFDVWFLGPRRVSVASYSPTRWMKGGHGKFRDLPLSSSQDYFILLIGHRGYGQQPAFR